MKQKRKVKSLIPQKNDLGGSLLTATLLVLGLALCLGSASLMTSSVGAASSSPTEYSQFQYSGTDDKVEVLYNLQFSKPEYLSGFVGEMYTDKNNDFYITSTPITVNESGVKAEDVNEVDKGLYSNILGGHKNKVHSNYVTTIGGEENVIAAGNANAVIFGGKNNEISGSAAGSSPSVIIGGHHNLIKGGHNGNTIIGGHDNSISGSVSNSFILGGISNKIVSDKGINNVIVGGSNVIVDTGDVFVFSNSAFKPQGNKTFYLNVSQGLGINADSIGKGVTVNGPVKFGEIDITKSEYPCNTSTNYGVIGSWNGCLVGCTPTTAVDGQWDLLDRGKRCQEACDNEDKCSNKMPAVKEPDAYSGFCTNGVNTGNASPCTPVWDEVKDVVFETALINSEQYGGKCPGADAVNKCVYQCNSGYYLTGDKTYSSSVNGGQIACYSICDLSKDLGPEWVNPDGTPIILKHNQMVTGYNTNNTTCARTNPYVDPSDAYGKDKGTKGEEFPEHCGNNQHKKPLVCVNGKMEIANNYNNPRSSSSNAKANGYTHRDCAVHPFTCDTSAGKFDLNRYYITTTLYDTPIVTDTEKDRKNMVGTRGTYKLCLDYDVLNSPNNEKAPGNEVCNVHLGNNKPYIEHYQFIGCNSTYHRSNRDGETDKYICRKECKISTDKAVRTVWDNRSITLYDRSEAECGKGLCREQTFTCNDGKWDKDQGEFRYESCTQKGNRCDGYNVDKTDHDNHIYNSYYQLCEKRMPFLPTSNQPNWTYKTYRNNNGYLKDGYSSIQECSYEQRYKLTGCNPCKHTTNGKWCDDDDDVSSASSCSYIAHGSVAGYYYNIWTSTTYNGGSFLKNQGKCEFYCYDGYYKCGSSCCSNPERECEKPEDGSGYYYTEKWSHDATKWYVGYDKKSNESGHVGELLEEGKDWCTHSCRDGYRQVNGNCVSTDEQDRGCIGVVPRNAKVIDDTYKHTMYPGEWHYSEDGDDCSFECEVGYQWNGYACEYIDWGCSDRCNYVVTLNPDGGTILGADSVNGCNVWKQLPQAEKECQEFLGWGSEKAMQVFVDSNKELTAQWKLDTSCNKCEGGTAPTSDSSTYDQGPNPTNGKKAWTPVDDYSKELTECQWRCKEPYVRVGDKCLDIECKPGDKPGDNPPAQNVDKGSARYLRTSLTDTNRKWKQGDPSNPCEWKCKSGFELSGSRDAGYECVKTVIAGCETIANGYCPTGNNRQDLVNLTVGAIKSGEKWKCKGTASTPKECVECLPGYRLTGNSYANYKCDVYSCDTETEPSCDVALKGPRTYTGENVVDNKDWIYTGKKLSELKACEWSCPSGYEKSGNCCVKTIEVACSNPEVHNHCSDDTTMQAINTGDIIVSGKHAGWKWDCAPKSGNTGDIVKCLECDESLGFQETEVDGKRTCAKDQDGECDFSKTNEPACKNGVKADIQTDEGDEQGGVTVWKCEGVGNGKAAICGVRAYCGGTCEALHNGKCSYLDREKSVYFDITKLSNCKNAAGYGGDSVRYENRCYLETNVFGDFSLKKCSDIGYGVGYGSCFEWKNGSAVCEVLNSAGNWEKASADMCKPISNKVPDECTFEPEEEDPINIKVTVIFPYSSVQCIYSNFLLIRSDYGGHVSPNGNYDWQQSNNGETHAVTFEVPATWANKVVTVQYNKNCNGYNYGNATAGGTNGDWEIPDHDVSFTYSNPTGI